MLIDEIQYAIEKERYTIAFPGLLRDFTNALCSSIGSLTNASKISRTLQSLRKTKVSSETVSAYISYLEDSFLFSEAARYDVKGKKYFEYPNKIKQRATPFIGGEGFLQEDCRFQVLRQKLD